MQSRSMIYSILWEKSQKYDLEKCDLLLDLELTEEEVYMYNKNIFWKKEKATNFYVLFQYLPFGKFL